MVLKKEDVDFSSLWGKARERLNLWREEAIRREVGNIARDQALHFFSQRNPEPIYALVWLGGIGGNLYSFGKSRELSYKELYISLVGMREELRRCVDGRFLQNEVAVHGGGEGRSGGLMTVKPDRFDLELLDLMINEGRVVVEGLPSDMRAMDNYRFNTKIGRKR